MSARRRRSRCGCGRRPSTRSSARTTCCSRVRRCGGWSRAAGPRRSSSTVRPAPARPRSRRWSRRPRAAASSRCRRSRPASRRSAPSSTRPPRRPSTGEQTVLFIDEVHRFSKTQQDSLLGAVEDRTVMLIAATTENPFFSVVSPLLSRSLVLQLQPLDVDAVRGRGATGRSTTARPRRRVTVDRRGRRPAGALLGGRRPARADRAGGRRRAAGASGVDGRGHRAVARQRRRCATTATAISTTTSSARSSSRSAAATSTPRCTTWPG